MPKKKKDDDWEDVSESEEETVETSDEDGEENDEEEENEEEETDEEEDDADDEEEEQQEPVIRKNPARKSRRRKVVAKNVDSDSEDEGSKTFWNQEFWQEKKEENFAEISSDDSEDFTSVDEAEAEQEQEKVIEKDMPKKKNVYVDPRARKKQPPQRTKRKRMAEPKIEPPRRASTRPTTQARTQEVAEKMKAREEMKIYHQPRKRKKVRKMTQREKMMEARRTEQENAMSLRELLRIEDDKKKPVAKKKGIQGPYMRMVTRMVTLSHQMGPGGRNYQRPGANRVPKTTFKFKGCRPRDVNFPTAPSKKIKDRPRLCAHSGRLARYWDPLSGQPYADLNAFKAIRKQRKLPLKPSKTEFQ